MNDDLREIPEASQLSKVTQGNIRQNVIIALLAADLLVTTVLLVEVP